MSSTTSKTVLRDCLSGLYEPVYNGFHVAHRQDYPKIIHWANSRLPNLAGLTHVFILAQRQDYPCHVPKMTALTFIFFSVSV